MSESAENSTPKIPLRFLRWFCHPDLLEDVEGDLMELYAGRAEKNRIKANILFLFDVLLLLRPGMIKNFKIVNNIINESMFRNYLKIALRNSLRYKGYTLLNLSGLVVGIASSILILLWVNDEVSVDQFHAKKDNIYQMFRNLRQSSGMVSTTFSIPKPAADLMKAEYSEVNELAVLSWPMDKMLAIGADGSKIEGAYASPEFIEMFSFEIVQGDQETALDGLNAIMISKSTAERYFGEDWEGTALGQTLRVDDIYDAEITGIFKDPDTNSSLDFDWLIPAETFYKHNDWVNDWGNGSFQVFFTVDDLAKAGAVADRVLNEINDHTKDNDKAGDEQLIIQKFSETYLYSNFDNGVISGGRIKYVNIMTVVAIFMLVVACINFMNLATARSDRRSKEIGIRKVMGARKAAISAQFFIEAGFLTLLSVGMSLVLVLLLLPYFNTLTGKILFIDFAALSTWKFLIGITFLVGLLSGSYPAVLLSRLNIIQSMKGAIQQSPITGYLRRGLVVFQFGISTLLIIGVMVIGDQLDYVLNKDLGIDKENLLVVRMEGDLIDRLDTYKTELRKIPEVAAVTVASGNPISYGRSTSSADWEGKDPAQGYEMNVILTDEDFIEAMGMKMKIGRSFSNIRNEENNYIINEVAAKIMGFDDPIDKNLSIWGRKGKIIGVVKNFHMKDLYKPIGPLIVAVSPTRTDRALIRIQGDLNKAILAIEKVTKELNPAYDFDSQFIDSSYEESYKSEVTVSVLSNIFSGISIFISCLGLFGLSAYTAERRSREIGVRKVHGASIWQVIVLLSKDYSKLMLCAFIVAIPFGYYYAEQWLGNFEFRTDLDWTMFLSAGLVTFFIGVITVSLKSYQAASVNPVNSLKDE